MEAHVNQVSGTARVTIEQSGGSILDDDAWYERREQDPDRPIVNLPDVLITFPPGTTYNEEEEIYTLPGGNAIGFTLQGEETWAVII